MDFSAAIGYVVVILLTLMTLLMTFFIYQQSKGNQKADETNKLLSDLTGRLIKLETEHNIMMGKCGYSGSEKSNHHSHNKQED
jgi:hypothetical protein